MLLVCDRCLSNQHRTARTPLPFSFLFPFFSAFFPLPFVVLRVPFLVPFLVRFCPFVLSSSVWVLYRLLRFYFLFSLHPCFPWWRILLFCFYFVSVLHSLPRSLRASSMRIPLACCLLSCVADVDLSFLFFCSLPSLFRFRFRHRLFSSCLFLLGTMLSPRFRFLLRLVWHMICILIRTYADVTFLFLSEVHDLFQLCVLSSVFICFPPEVIFRSRVIGACPVTTDCIVAMS